MEEKWQNGLCKEYVKSVEEIINEHDLGMNLYDFYRIGKDVVMLHREMFDDLQ